MKERNYALVFAYLKQQPYLTKEDIAREYSAGRTDSLRELTEAEYHTMIRHLRELMTASESLRQQRSKVMRLMQIYGIDTSDWARVNHFCSDKRIAGKPFARLRIEELKALAKKLRAMQDKQSAQKRAVQERLRQAHASERDTAEVNRSKRGYLIIGEA